MYAVYAMPTAKKKALTTVYEQQKRYRQGDLPVALVYLLKTK